MKINRVFKYITACFLLALCQVALGTAFSSYLIQQPVVNDSTTGSVDFTKLLCFSSLGFGWVILTIIFRSIIAFIIEITVPTYTKTSYPIKSLFFFSLIIKIVIITIPTLLELTILRKYHKTKNINYLYLYFFISATTIALQTTYQGTMTKKIFDRASNSSYYGSKMQLSAVSSFRDTGFFLMESKKIAEQKTAVIWLSISYKVLYDFLWIGFLDPKSLEIFLKKKAPFWTHLILSASMLVSWGRFSPYLEVFFACHAYIFLCYMASKIFLITRIRLFFFLPFLLQLNIGYIDLLYSQLDSQVKFICCAVLICLDYLISYTWEED